MSVFSKVIKLSKQLAASLLKEVEPKVLEKSTLFDEKDKQYILKNLTNASLIKERKQIKSQIDKQADLEKIKKRISIPASKMYWWYSAAASVVIIVSSAYVFKDSLFLNTKKTNRIVANKIEIGTNKAILTLEDGTSVRLEKGKNYQISNIQSNGEELIYNSSKNSKSEIAYNYLTIPRGGQFFLKLADGTKVWLNSESQLKYPIAFVEGDTREVELVYGEAYFDVSPSTKHKGARFKVINKNQEVEVIGTEFNISAYKDDADTKTTLVKGKVVLTYEGEKHNLVPNEQSHLDFKTNRITLKNVDIYNEISWKEGVFSFKNKPLKDIMQVLARWYNMQVSFENKESQNIEFNGVLDKNQSIEEILTIIKNFKVINNYLIKDKDVVIK